MYSVPYIDDRSGYVVDFGLCIACYHTATAITDLVNTDLECALALRDYRGRPRETQRDEART